MMWPQTARCWICHGPAHPPQRVNGRGWFLAHKHCIAGLPEINLDATIDCVIHHDTRRPCGRHSFTRAACAPAYDRADVASSGRTGELKGY
jgi:hypothetical protein